MINRTYVFKPVLSIIMPVYNAADTVVRAVHSVFDTFIKFKFELIVIDDCSNDNTYETVQNLHSQYPRNLILLQTAKNSGGPSGPRNLGIEKARGEYVTFVDDDDWVDAYNMWKLCDFTIANKHDLVKSYLINVKNGQQTIANRIFTNPKTKQETINDLIAYQSTNSDFIVKRSVLINNNIRYPEDIRIGEDTVFFLETLAKSESPAYNDRWFFWYHTVNAFDPNNPSSTQRCDDREVNQQITAWERSEKISQQMGVSYNHLRLHIGFRNLLTTIVRFSNGISEDTYNRLHQFALSIKNVIKDKMNLHKRYEDLYQAILKGDYQGYLSVAKRRFLINGYDLKFITPLIPYLEKTYNVKVDEWTGHDAHNKKRSDEMAQWADIIWCEWLLGNAVFFSNKKNDNQRLVIRAHRFEITRNFGQHINYDNVDLVFAVGQYYYDAFMKTFKISESKMRLLPNYVEETIYSTNKAPDYKYHIGLVGILPARKGLHRGLELLQLLHKQDKQYKLFILGQNPKEVSWINNNPTESKYFDECYQYIKNHNLTSDVVFCGHKDRKDLYEDIGYVLSLSDDDVPESFHLSPAEGAVSGSMGLVRPWPGAEYIYPRDFIHDTLDDMANEIIRATKDDVYFNDQSGNLKNYVLTYYSLDKFFNAFDLYMKQAFMM